MNLKSIIKEAVESLERNKEKFHYDAALISRFLYTSYQSFRTMRGHQYMKRVDQALSKYLNFNIVSTLELFHGQIPDSNSVPYREYLEYILLKLQGTSKLLSRILECSVKSMRYLLGLMRNGGFIPKSAMFMASISRVWDICRDYCETIVDTYNKLFKFREILKYKSKKSSTAYEFPENLKDFLGEEYARLVDSEAENSKVLQDFAEKSVKLENEVLMETKSDEIEISEDFGEPISRNSFLKSEENRKVQLKEQEMEVEESSHSLDSLTNQKSIKKFLKNESAYRKSKDLKSMTIKKLKDKDYKQFKKDLLTKSALVKGELLKEYAISWLSDE